MFQKRSVWKVQKEVGFGEPLKHCDEDVMFNKAVNLHLVDPFVKAEDLSKVVLVVVTKKVPILLWITNCFLLILPNGKALFCSCISPLESNSHKNEKRKRNVELHCLQSSEYFMKTCSKIFKSQRLFLIYLLHIQNRYHTHFFYKDQKTTSCCSNFQRSKWGHWKSPCRHWQQTPLQVLMTVRLYKNEIPGLQFYPFFLLWLTRSQGCHIFDWMKIGLAFTQNIYYR